MSSSSTNFLYVYGFVFVVFMSNNMAAYADTEVHKKGNSTAIITQENTSSSGSKTEVMKTPDGQKIITRDGQNTDITIQQSTPGSQEKNSTNNANEGIPTPDEYKERISNRNITSPRARQTRSDIRKQVRPNDIPTASEYREHIRSRMRPLLPGNR